MREKSIYQRPAPGCYRLLRGVHIAGQGDNAQVICPYPLRILRPGHLATRILRLCTTERSIAELARAIGLPPRRVEALCEQLRRKGLLEAGPHLPPATWPGVSVIVPTYNRAAQLERCLRSLLALDYPAQLLEVIVVDDASNDATGALLQRMVPEFASREIALRLVRHERRLGAAWARNSGAEVARHALLAFIDSDCVASRDWLRELAPAFEDVHIGAAGGMIRAYERDSLLGRYEDVRSSLFMGVQEQQVRPEGPLTYLPTANLLVRRATWREIGGFAPLEAGEDVDFCRRLLARGAGMLYLPQGIVYHDYRTRLRDFLRIRAFYASSEAALLQRHPRERRVLVLPPEQASFAGLALGGASILLASVGSGSRQTTTSEGRLKRARPVFALFSLLCALLEALAGGYRRWRRVREQRAPLAPGLVLWATLRGHLAYTYHLCRHLTRYYTLPLLALGLLLPPCLFFVLVLYAIVSGVDYKRLRPRMSLAAFMLCSLLEDCAYEIGLLAGCLKQRTWKPLLPLIRRGNTRAQNTRNS